MWRRHKGKLQYSIIWVCRENMTLHFNAFIHRLPILGTNKQIPCCLNDKMRLVMPLILSNHAAVYALSLRYKDKQQEFSSTISVSSYFLSNSYIIPNNCPTHYQRTQKEGPFEMGIYYKFTLLCPPCVCTVEVITGG